jgi:ABC-type antimicrobial peptide transport system permease subunit
MPDAEERARALAAFEVEWAQGEGARRRRYVEKGLIEALEAISEIGLRLAVGARPRDIRGQFLVESATLSLLGGLAGIVVGIGAAGAIAAFAGWPILISSASVLIAVGFSAAVGVFFGYYPALRASRLDPIAALRSE